MKRFPAGTYGRQELQFFASPFRSPVTAFASLVFPWDGEKVLVADIRGRGWCIPSGRVEPNESSLDAAQREALEEAGAILKDIQYIGCYHMSESQVVRWADCYVARVERLEDIGKKEESLGRRLVTLEELPNMYYLWNDLTKMVFEYSKEILGRCQK